MFGCAWKINFPENIFSWPCVLMALTRKWFEVKIFTLNHFRTRTQRQNFHFKPFPDSCAKTEREREEEERAQSFDRAPVRRPQQHTPQTKLQSDNHRLSSSSTTHTPPVSSIVAPRWSHQSRRSQHRANRTAPFKQRSTPTPLDLAFTSATRSCL